jgi:CubicO group peptidase (beta-lactamase class C family)
MQGDKKGARFVAANESRSGLDRRSFMKLAGAATAVATGELVAQPLEGAPIRKSRSDDTRRKGRAMSTGGFSRSRLALLHDVMAAYVKRGDMPGIVLGLSRRDAVHVDVIGTLAIGGRDPMRRDSIFRIASLSKPVVAVATLILVEECKLRLDEPVDRLLPELAGRKVLRRLDGPLDDTVRILSRPTVETMISDQLTPQQKAISGLVPGYFDSHGWGLGLSVVTKREDLAARVGRFGWDGGLGTSWYSDPHEDLVGVLLTQRAWTSPVPPLVCQDFWTSAYQAIDD